jgi:hypothetical protein
MGIQKHFRVQDLRELNSDVKTPLRTEDFLIV